MDRRMDIIMGGTQHRVGSILNHLTPATARAKTLCPTDVLSLFVFSLISMERYRYSTMAGEEGTLTYSMVGIIWTFNDTDK
jgi:hypothetical protein